MRIFITGLSGLFGLNAALTLLDRGHEIWGSFLTHPVALPERRARKLDVRDRDAVLHVFREIRPDVVIHAAATTSVDACEDDPGKAKEMNIDATRAVVRAAFHVHAKIVHLSTDQVFGGTKPWAKESLARCPINEYGRTKLEGEGVLEGEGALESEDVAVHAREFLIIRTNFFGWGSPHRPSLSDWILARLRAGEEVPGFTDVYFTPILVNDLIDRIMALLANCTHSDVFHVPGATRVSKYKFAQDLARAFDLKSERIRSTRVADAQLRAKRPLDMSLDGSKVNKLLGMHGLPCPELQDGLARLKGLEVRGWPERIQHMLVQPRQVSA
jgi:dTDP-4-dehydrorhamnose reductase